jgi:hypothetical protein
MPLPGNINRILDDALDVLVPKFAPKQTAYLFMKKRYWQGIFTPTVVPQNGTLGTMDKTLRPTDQEEDWTYLALSETQLPFSVSCDTHDGPLGKGYTIMVATISGGTMWIKAVGFGQHSKTFDWTEHRGQFGILG